MTAEKIRLLIFRVDEQNINENSLKQVKSAIGDVKADRLFLYIHSYGGEPGGAVRTIRFLQSRFKKITCLIPGRAMSAATLMSLGTDEIYMFPDSAMGPLDLQVEHPVDRTQMSSLNIRDTFFTISSISNSLATSRLVHMVYGEYVKLNKKDAARIAYETATEFVKPIICQIDPYHLHDSFRNSQLGEIYAQELLMSRMMKGKRKLAQQTAEKLANKYVSHDYVISPEEAILKLSLTVKKLDDLKEWGAIKSHIEGDKDVISYLEIDEVNEPAPVEEKKKPQPKEDNVANAGK